MRMCVGCRQMRPKKDLIRVVRNKEGEMSLDFKGKAPGRGAYICPDAACLEKAVKSRAIERALEQKVEPELLEALKTALQDG
ncbi:YlxR family protein [Christensenellaceae bacterium OttesenSCG-928-L17]|nr:YlxR family protein [Christensenellaceae bacterium OttesenSCG-928-L17]